MSATDSTGFPSVHSTTSYWQTHPSALADYRSSPGLPPSADFVIVGSGITGASVALKLLGRHPKAKIVMLEARAASSGATSRNGGHCRPNWYYAFARDLAELGLEEALRVQQFEQDSVAELTAFIEQSGIECDLRQCDTMDIFIDSEAAAEAEASFEKLKGCVAKPQPAWITHLELLKGPNAARKSGMHRASAAMSFSAFKLHPYKLATAMLSTALKTDMALYTHTQVKQITHCNSEDGQPSWKVVTVLGEMHATNVILATNGYTPALYAPLEGRIIPTRGQAAALRPGSLIAGSSVLQQTAGVFDVVSVDYLQSRSDDTDGAGDIVFGGGRAYAPGGEQPMTDDSTIHPAISEHLNNALPRYFGEQKWGERGEALIEWTGIMGYTNDKRPYIGQIPGKDKLWVCAGFNGHGMALCYRAAEALVQLIGNEEAEWIPRSFLAERIAVNA